jgi:hypothetical protein
MEDEVATIGRGSPEMGSLVLEGGGEEEEEDEEVEEVVIEEGGVVPAITEDEGNELPESPDSTLTRKFTFTEDELQEAKREEAAKGLPPTASFLISDKTNVGAIVEQEEENEVDLDLGIPKVDSENDTDEGQPLAPLASPALQEPDPAMEAEKADPQTGEA